MPFVPTPETVELSFRTTWDGQQTQNRIYVSVNAAVTQALCDAVAALGLEWWTTDVVPLVAPNLFLREAHVRDLSSETGFEASAPPPGSLPGTNGSPSLPNNVALCCSIRTGHIGRSARGRWYWQGLSEAQVTASHVEPTVGADIVNTLIALAGQLATAGFNWVTVSYISGGLPRVGGPLIFGVTDVLLVDEVLDSQRRRLPGRGA